MRITALAMGVVLLCGQVCFGGWQFQWGGVVTQIMDQADMDASLGGVNVGDTMSASFAYDVANFDPGVEIPSGREYNTDIPGRIWIRYLYSSGDEFYRTVTSVTARDGGDFDQWNWMHGSEILFQQNDFTDSSWDLPLASSFENMHDLYRDQFAALVPSGNANMIWPGFTPEGWRMVSIDLTYWFLSTDEEPPAAVPVPAAVLLTGLGAGLIGGLRRRRSL